MGRMRATLQDHKPRRDTMKLHVNRKIWHCTVEAGNDCLFSTKISQPYISHHMCNLSAGHLSSNIILYSHSLSPPATFHVIHINVVSTLSATSNQHCVSQKRILEKQHTPQLLHPQLEQLPAHFVQLEQEHGPILVGKGV